MPLFDCSCHLRLQGRDLHDLHFAIAAFARLCDERDDVIGALFSRTGAVESVELTIEADSAEGARVLADAILGQIAADTAERFGLDAALADGLVVRETPFVSEDLLRRIDEGEGEGGDLDLDFARRLLSAARGARREPVADPEAAIRDAGTAALALGMGTEDILRHLESWREIARFDVVDVGPHNVTLAFHELPLELEAFAVEALSVCPDLVDEVEELDEALGADPEVIERVVLHGLAANLRRERLLRLWWD